jgi:hypothetical protein
LVRIDLTRHNHHPHQENTPNNPKRKLRLPALANIALLQERERIPIRPRGIVVKHVRIALVVDIRASEKLDRGPDYAGDEQYEQDEREEHHSAWEQLALRDKDDFNDDEEDGEGADGYAVGHYPVRCVSTVDFYHIS